MSTLKSALIATDFSVDIHVDAAAQAQQALAAVALGLRQKGLDFAPRLVSGDVSAELARLAAPPKRLRHAMRRGYPPRVILDCAKEDGAQLILIGKHCAGIIERSLVGSVALQVLEMAECDVLIVPEAA